ncbi:gliding motility protein GldC [Mangrovivirga sp. M17]|uniref:Gliding motility protein GldC n=2 Tax=Mangrovivirga TaxID=2858886 RepID=A0A4D7JUM4_9BACT|nr:MULTISPECIES: gliding motility protein GldC [Mangrovivirga]MCX2745241.1 gliding motility protein GldC [Mangrovivirga halotolerans]QCK15876.1 gliding motility protein GldC [Mangrovivirga cuniculi]
MKKSSIKFNVILDDENVPEKIEWTADDKPGGGLDETNAISVSVWDQSQNNTLRIDLWNKEMPVNEMKKFYIDIIGGLAQSLLTSTADEYMTNEMNSLCDRLIEHVRKESQGK